jgi:uncharacterized membrane protein
MCASLPKSRLGFVDQVSKEPRVFDFIYWSCRIFAKDGPDGCISSS